MSASKNFFLDAAPGRRYCLLHTPDGAARACVVYLHPFGDEMNKSRRMAALQARALAQAGYAVLQIDLYGCGDSSGEFAEASWTAWRSDAATAVAFMRTRFGLPVLLWGLRLGALLALDVSAELRPAGLLLWQPVLNGSTFLTQFLRLRAAGAMLTGETEGGTKASRAALAAGATLEVGGYELSAALAAGLDALDARATAPPCALSWFELAPEAGRTPAVVSTRIAEGWGARPVVLVGPPFWQTQEIETAPALLSASVDAADAMLKQAAHASRS